MKKKNYIKFSILGLLSVAAVTPTVVLTSCSTTSQWNLPIMIGGVGKDSPWYLLRNDTASSGGAVALNGYDNSSTYVIPGDVTSDNPDHNYYSPAEQFNNYLPDSSISYTDPKSGTTNYAYATAYNDTNWKATDDKKNTSANYQSAWLDPTDKKLNFAESYDIKKANNTDLLRTQQIATSMRNFNILNALGLNSIASVANLYNSGLIQFMSQTGVLNGQHTDDWYNALFGNLNAGNTGGFTHGTKTEQSNKDFFEFLYDSLNVLNEGNFAAKFGESTVNYQLASYTYGPGPYISYENAGAFGNTNTVIQPNTWYTGDASERNFDFSIDSAVSVPLLNKPVDTDDAWSINPSFVRNGDASLTNHIASPVGAYVSFSDYYADNAKYNFDNLQPNTFYPAGIGSSESTVSIPFLITPGDTSFAYYNPTKAHSYQQKDYLINDISIVQKQVEKSNAWNSFPNHVDSTTFKKGSWAESLKWNVSTKNASEDIADNNFAPFDKAGSDLYSALDTALGNKASWIDPSIDNIFSATRQTVKNKIGPNDFVGFATYSFLPFPHAQANTDNPTDIKYDYLPVFQGIQTNTAGTLPAIFPVSMLYNYNDDTMDTSLFKAQMLPEANAIYNYKGYDSSKGYGAGSDVFGNDTIKANFKNNPANNMYYFDMDKLFEKETKILNVIDCNRLKSDKTPKDFVDNGFTYKNTANNQDIVLTSGDIKEALYVLQHLYGNWTTADYGANWALDPLSSTDFIKPLE